MADSSQKDTALLKAVIERLSTPDRLDLLLNVITPRMWVPLLSLGILALLALAWSFLGRIPEAIPCTVATVSPVSGGTMRTPAVIATVPAEMAGELRPGMMVRVVSSNRNAFLGGVSGTIATVIPGRRGGTNVLAPSGGESPDHGKYTVEITIALSRAGSADMRKPGPEKMELPPPGTELDARLVVREHPPISLFLPSFSAPCQ